MGLFYCLMLLICAKPSTALSSANDMMACQSQIINLSRCRVKTFLFSQTDCCRAFMHHQVTAAAPFHDPTSALDIWRISEYIVCAGSNKQKHTKWYVRKPTSLLEKCHLCARHMHCKHTCTCKPASPAVEKCRSAKRLQLLNFMGEGRAGGGVSLACRASWWGITEGSWMD